MVRGREKGTQRKMTRHVFFSTQQQLSAHQPKPIIIIITASYYYLCDFVSHSEMTHSPLSTLGTSVHPPSLSLSEPALRLAQWIWFWYSRRKKAHVVKSPYRGILVKACSCNRWRVFRVKIKDLVWCGVVNAVLVNEKF